MNEFKSGRAALLSILQSREMEKLQQNYPLWKLKLTDEEYESLKQTLRNHPYDMHRYDVEAALCYAEWWRRDYRGNIPSKENVALGIGLLKGYGDDLYKAARSALEKRKYTFIHSLKGTEYFRTLLNQGGLPVNYIKNGNLGSFSRFLGGLVRELSIIRYDWNNEDNSIIQQFNCISYLSKAFKNENIYDVSMQIAHAIIMDDKTLLPYDDTDDASLANLTKSLEKEYSKRERKPRPLSLHWKLCLLGDGQGLLLVNMDVVKDISSDSIPGLDTSTCYSFDVFVAGTFVGKYTRKSINQDNEGNISSATYTRISVGVSKDILWKGEPVVEVKIRCDNDDRIFLTVAGCYPPNLEVPQLFQMLDDNIYSKSETAKSEENIAIFIPEWNCEGACPIAINGQPLLCAKFSQSINLFNENTGDKILLTNEFTPYTAEFSGNYISWLEESNYKLLAKIPVIHVYDKDKNRVENCKIRYRKHSSLGNWKPLNSSCVFSPGLVDIKVDFPDGHFTIETFYAIGDMSFSSCNESTYSTEIICNCSSSSLSPKMLPIENAEVSRIDSMHWQVNRDEKSATCPSVCRFRIYNSGNPVLQLAVTIPFDGITITDIDGNIVPKGKVVSFANLAHFFIISHGNKNRKVDVSYSSDRIDSSENPKHLQSKVIEGRVSLSDYNDLIVRMFNLYGSDSFDRSSSVVLNVPGHKIYVRKFVLDTTIHEGNIIVTDDTDDTSDFQYEGDLFASPVGDDVPTEEFNPVKLIKQEGETNTYCFPDSFDYHEVIVFSGAESKRRIIPKYFNRLEEDFDKAERSRRSSILNKRWNEYLSKESVISGKHWRDVCKAFDICCHYNLPFTTYKGLEAVAQSPELLSDFVIAMCLHGYKEVLAMDINRFEQELAVALHWIPVKIWEKSIQSLRESNSESSPATLVDNMMKELVPLIQELFNSTVSTDIASEFATYITTGGLGKGDPILKSDISNYQSKIRGLSDNNCDLPIISFDLNGNYYPQQCMLPSYQAMIESAMCAAESACDVKNHINLFERKEHARIVNFYRKYFKKTYSDIFFRTVKLISNK